MSILPSKEKRWRLRQIRRLRQERQSELEKAADHAAHALGHKEKADQIQKQIDQLVNWRE